MKHTLLYTKESLPLKDYPQETITLISSNIEQAIKSQIKKYPTFMLSDMNFEITIKYNFSNIDISINCKKLNLP